MPFPWFRRLRLVAAHLATHVCGVAALAWLVWYFGSDAASLAAARASLDASGWLRLICDLGVAAGCGWALLVGLIADAAMLPGRAGRGASALADRVTPALLRRALVLGLSAGALTPAAHAMAAPSAATVSPVSALAGLSTAVTADPDTGLPDPSLRPDGTTRELGADILNRLRGGNATSATPRPSPRPSSATTPPAAAPHPDGTRRPSTTPTAPSPGRSVTVAPGDTLWDIAARDLGGSASPQRIATAWPRWFAANRPLLDDPDLLFPGQVLHAPSTGTDQS